MCGETKLVAVVFCFGTLLWIGSYFIYLAVNEDLRVVLLFSA